MRSLKILAIFLLAGLAGCSNSSSDVSSSLQPGTSQAVSTATLVIDHSGVSARALDPDVTHLRITGLSKDTHTTTFPAQTRERGNGKVTVSGVPTSTRVVQVEYLNQTTVVGRGESYVHLSGGQTSTLKDPYYERQPEGARSEDSEGNFGADPATSGSPILLTSPSPGAPGINLRAFAAKNVPLALPPQYILGSAVFGPKPQLPSGTNLTSLPPVGMQGTPSHLGYPGTCLAWAFGYGLGSYTAAQGAALTNDTLASPMYLYEMALQVLPLSETSTTQANGTVVRCSKSNDVYLPFMVGYGAATLTNVPYVASCNTLLSASNTVATQPVDSGLALGSYGHFQSSGANAISVDSIKQYLVNGQPIAFVTPVWSTLLDLPTSGGVFYGSTCTTGGHAMLIVGYDDTLGAPGHKGAFLVQNSFGTEWPDPPAYPTPSPCPGNSGLPTPDPSPTNPAGPGRYYLAYEAYFASAEGGSVAYPVQPAQPSSGLLTASNASAPAACVNALYQVNNGGDQTLLVLNHWFAGPVVLESLTVTDPGNRTVTAPLLYPMRTGYTYLRRHDGQAFQNGAYALTITAHDGQGNPLTYTGNVTLSNLANNPFPVQTPAPMPNEVDGPTGEVLFVK